MSTIATQIISKLKEANRPLVVGVSGGSASGKSTYSHQINLELQELGCNVTVINQDDFAIGRHFKNKHTSPYKWDDPDNYRLSDCAATISSLKRGKATTFMAYTLEAHEPILSKTLKSYALSHKPYVIIVEGIFAWYGTLAPIIDYKIYLDADFYRRFVLRLNRNVYESKHTDVDTVIRQYFTHVARAQFDLLDPLKNSADVIIGRDIPLPQVTSDSTPKESVRYMHRDESLGIGLSGELQQHLVVTIDGLLLFNLPINKESALLISGWKT